MYFPYWKKSFDLDENEQITDYYVCAGVKQSGATIEVDHNVKIV